MPMDSEDDGYDVVVVGSSNTTQDGGDALASYLGTGLEICLDDTLELTSNCPSGYGFILSFTMEVSSISDLTITFTTTAGPVVEEVRLLYIHLLFLIRPVARGYVGVQVQDCAQNRLKDSFTHHFSIIFRPLAGNGDLCVKAG